MAPQRSCARCAMTASGSGCALPHICGLLPLSIRGLYLPMQGCSPHGVWSCALSPSLPSLCMVQHSPSLWLCWSSSRLQPACRLRGRKSCRAALMPMCLPYDLAHLCLLCPTRHISTAIATLCTAPNSCTKPGGRYSPAQAGRVGLRLAAEG